VVVAHKQHALLREHSVENAHYLLAEGLHQERNVDFPHLVGRAEQRNAQRDLDALEVAEQCVVPAQRHVVLGVLGVALVRHAPPHQGLLHQVRPRQRSHVDRIQGLKQASQDVYTGVVEVPVQRELEGLLQNINELELREQAHCLHDSASPHRAVVPRLDQVYSIQQVFVFCNNRSGFW